MGKWISRRKGAVLVVALFRSRQQKWHIITAAPKGEAGRQWGDYWFAQDLAEAFTAQGAQAKVYSHAKAKDPKFLASLGSQDNVLVLRGLRRIDPPAQSQRSGSNWFLWVISHPELIEPGEAAQYTKCFAASQSWQPAETLGAFTPLLQATNIDRFRPMEHARREGVLFVGSTRGEFRPIVKDCLNQGIDVTLYGVGWEEFVDPETIAGEFLDNSELPAAYAHAAVVLNDHHVEMARHGFLSNRLFDAVSAGARVVSDQTQGLTEVFGSSVVQYESPEHLARIVADPDAYFGDAAADRDRIRAEHSFAARARYLMKEAESG